MSRLLRGKSNNHKTNKDNNNNLQRNNKKKHQHHKQNNHQDSNNRDSTNQQQQHSDDSKYVNVETKVVYPSNLPDEDDNDVGQQLSSIGRQIDNNNNKSTPVQQQQPSSSTETCPPLFLPSSKIQSLNEPLPPFHHRLQCNTIQSLSTHPFLYLTFIITIVLFCIYTTFCKSSRNHHNPYRHNSNNSNNKRRRCCCGILSLFSKNNQNNYDNQRGEYSVLETVYDELLDDFENEDLSSYLQDDDDDDSVGTIISQWSEHGENENKNGNNGKIIELTSFDDGHLSLKEMNG